MKWNTHLGIRRFKTDRRDRIDVLPRINSENDNRDLENQKAMLDCHNRTLLFDFRDLFCRFRTLGCDKAMLVYEFRDHENDKPDLFGTKEISIVPNQYSKMTNQRSITAIQHWLFIFVISKTIDQHYEPTFRTARNASCGMSTFPTRFMRRLPSFCFSRSSRLRVMSPP